MTEPKETAEGLPREIRATVHGGAMKVVTRFFNPTVQDILAELYQNARRSGARRVEVTTADEQS